MKKAHDLRQHLLDSIKALRDDPARLLMFIEKGGIVCRAGSLSFAYRYTLTVVITDYADHADTLVLPLLDWLTRNQSELLQDANRASAFDFTAEIIDHDRSDVEFQLDLTERVVVAADAAGNLVATHCDEPPPPDLSGPVGWQMNPG